LPYNVADVTFASEQPGVTLAGTLTWPEGAGPFPAVVLITGSGAQNPNDELFNHRPFLVRRCRGAGRRPVRRRSVKARRAVGAQSARSCSLLAVRRRPILGLR
jgi:hypothetical protein